MALPDTRSAPWPTAEASLSALLVVAAVAGLVLGVVDLALQATLPYPLANLANSSAVWALCAFGLARWTRTTPNRAALAGMVHLAVAVEAYELAAVIADLASPAALTAPSTLAWLLFGLLAGAGFCVAGAWAGQLSGWRPAAGVAATASVFLAEAGGRLLPGSASALDDPGTVLIAAGLAAAVLLVSVRRRDQLARAVLLVPPLTAVGILLFALAGF